MKTSTTYVKNNHFYNFVSWDEFVKEFNKNTAKGFPINFGKSNHWKECI